MKVCQYRSLLFQRIRGKADLKVPRIEQIIKTPIFDRTGELHTRRGYVPELEAYLAHSIRENEGQEIPGAVDQPRWRLRVRGRWERVGG